MNRENKFLEEMQNIQNIIFEDFKKINFDFVKEGIKWFPHGGTLLGAHRHQGFIPWDDDIDMWMSLNEIKNNYSKIRNIIERHGYRIYSRLGTHTKRKTIAFKLLKREIINVNNKQFRPFIDVMATQPYSSMPNEDFIWIRRSVREWSMKKRGIHSSLMKKKLDMAQEEFMRKFNYSESDKYRFIDWKAEHNWAWNISDLTTVKFNDIELFAPRNYEEWFLHFYDENYNTVPSVPTKQKHIQYKEEINLKFIDLPSAETYEEMLIE